LKDSSDECAGDSEVERSTLGQPSEVAKVAEGADEESPPDGKTEIEETGEGSAVNDTGEEDDVTGDAPPEEIFVTENVEYGMGADEEDGTVVEDVMIEEYIMVEEDTEDKTAEEDATLDEDEKAARAAATSVSLR
jgi:hypothetical protein